MSAPTGPGRSRASSRSRGSTRGIARGRDSRNGARGGHVGRYQARGANTSSEHYQHLKAPAKQNQIRNKPWKDPAQLTSAILDHAGRPSNSKNEPWRNPATEDSGTYKKRMSDLYQTLKDDRERERKQAIKDGFLADPDKPTSLANAITPVGTCQDMCPEFERVERIVQMMVDGCEKETSTLGIRVPCEALMVKRFRRSAAGYDEQLPSDIRPPAVLKKTLDYLFNDVVGGPEPLATIHKFVWDRTRGIRNDFSIQQVTRTDDLRVAIECFERIARFHILSLHQLSRTDLKDHDFDHHQEREQLNNTLLSLMYYYDDSRHKLTSPNEAEFRAYCVIFEIQDQRPDLEDRAQSWPRPILKDPRVQTALKLYGAATNASDEQGPLRPRTPFSIAQANTGGFWNLVKSNSVSYLTACVVEIYFNMVRATALEAIWKAYKGKRGGSAKMEDWVLQDLTIALGFDDEEQTAHFCEDHELGIVDNDQGEAYVDLGSVTRGELRDSNPRRKQVFSKVLVEPKRFGRTLPAVINGLTASQAQAQGLIEDIPDADNFSNANSESLFIDGDSDDDDRKVRSRSGSLLRNEVTNGTASPSTTANPLKPTTMFGQPSTMPKSFQPTSSEQPQGPTPSVFGLQSSAQPKPNPFVSKESPKFTQLQAPAGKDEGSIPGATPKFNFFPTVDSSSSTDPTPLSDPPVVAQQPPLSNATFGQPSSPFGKNPFIGTSTGSTPSAPSFSSTPHTVPASSTTKPELVGNQASQQQTSRDTFSAAPQPKLPTFSFGTSLLFETPKVKGPSNGSSNAGSQHPESRQSHVQNTTPKAFPTFNLPPQKPEADLPSQTPATSSNNSTSVSSPGPSNPPTFPSLLSSTKASSNSINNEYIPTQPTAAPIFHTSANTAAEEKPFFQAFPRTSSSVQSSLGISAEATKSSAVDTSSSTSCASKSSTTTPSTQPPSRIARPDVRTPALAKLSQSLMTEEGGLLQQFVEFTMAPIIKASLARFEDEKSWVRARECRVFLLARKFFERWKANAWSLGLKRRGKERRRNLAQAIRDKALSPSPRPDQSKNFPFSRSVPQAEEVAIPKVISNMPPPSTTQKRQSLPAQLAHKHDRTPDSSQTAINNKRKRDENDTSMVATGKPPNKLRHTHKRSSTIAETAMSAPPHRASRTPFRTSVDLSRIGDGSLLGDTLMRQARRLAPNVRSDTTRTDYFKLKAMGVDPDTSIVPQTKPRSRPPPRTNESSEANAEPTSTPNEPTTPSATPISPPKPPSEDDEALFASLRAVRATLADSTTWFQQERQTIERSLTPQTSALSPPNINNETPATRRLREIRERGRVPSRSEVRLRAMGDSALLPKGFWDGEGMGLSLYGKGKRKEEKAIESREIDEPTQPRAMGFAALSQQRVVNGNVEGERREGNQPLLLGETGASAEDAIEL